MTCVLFGSQTGQAKSIAEDLFEKLTTYIPSLRLYELDEIEKSFDIYKLNYAIIICSTTGDGDAPDNASSFLRKIKLYQPNSLATLRYTILGLGDTNYSNFCACSKSIDNLLQSLGAQKFYPSGWADDAVGLELVVEPWLDGFYEISKDICSDVIINEVKKISITETVVKNETKLSKSTDGLFGEIFAEDMKNKNLTVPALPSPFLTVLYHRDQPKSIDNHLPYVTTAAMPSSGSDLFIGELKQIEKMTNKFAVKSVYKVSINVPNADWKWNPGDSVGIQPCNSLSEVEAILSRLSIPITDWDQPVSLVIDAKSSNRRAKIPEHLVVRNSDMGISLKSILMWLCDIRTPLGKPALRSMAECCPTGSAEQRRLLELCSREGQAFYTQCIREPAVTILDLLNGFPSCSVSIERLLEFLPRLKPRAYSLCDLKEVSFAFSRVDIAPKPPLRKRPLTGVCTSWLESMTKLPLDHETPPKIPIYLRKNLNGFTVGEDASVPHILIGPGTGVSPFIGFLKHFEMLKKSGVTIGPIWLFFGCRNEERDFIFQTQLKHFFNTGVLGHFCVCFSRDDSSKSVKTDRIFCLPPDSKYVQDCLMFHSQVLTKLLLDDHARVFVCGDASGMAKDVMETWSQLLVGHDERIKSKKESDSFITSMRVNKLYLEDIWI